MAKKPKARMVWVVVLLRNVSLLDSGSHDVICGVYAKKPTKEQLLEHATVEGADVEDFSIVRTRKYW